MDRRRFLLTSLAGAVTMPLTADAEQARRLPRIGLLDARQPSSPDPILEGFREGLREAGYTEGQNILVELRWASGDLDRFPDLAAELVRLKVDVIVAGGNQAVRAAKQATHTIPIVMLGGDPVADGLISSLARPGGNVTGVVVFSSELTGAAQGSRS
jgi:putative tryptophan/tyrosine transport system substrate-binding protein